MARDARTDDPPSINFADLSFREYMVECGQSDPRHFGPLCDAIEDAVVRGKKIRCVVEGPRQHGKTTIVEHAEAWALHKLPELPACYATYGQDYSGKRSREIRHLYQRTGGRLSPDHNTIQEWRNTRGGGLLATSPGGSLVGHTVKLAFLDDLLKGRAEAEVLANRELIDSWLRSDLLGCMTPSGSIFLVASRYHEDDESGRLITRGWDRLRFPALCDDPEHDPLGRVMGEPLCPWGPDPREPRTLEFLLEKCAEVGEYDWDSLYMCRPRPAGGALFRNATLCDSIPRIVRAAWGADFAYSATGDYIALVLLGLGDDGYLYVLDVRTWRKSIVEVLGQVLEARATNAEAQVASYVSGPERGVLQMLSLHNPPLRVRGLPARWSKLYRAEKTATRWNRGEIRILRGSPWADSFVRIVCGFTGLGDGRDDEVDALVSAHDWLMISGSAVAPGTLRGPYVW